MTEKEFWLFLNGKLAQGRQEQMSVVTYSNNPQVKEAVKYIGAHSFLPKEYNNISEREIVDMGRLLLDGMAAVSTKEAILVLLAHIPSKEALNILKTYNELPEEGLKLFAQMALDECEMWNE
ncbi:MAG: hypothetical protein Q8R48_07865 [Candidatus Omnitrophota bacterium]|nr:hypothetical protein [Candidatus Omnitrophota bacterium]